MPIPAPPDPALRKQPLPAETPRPKEGDPAAFRRVETILNSPSYSLAIDDPAFLALAETRAPRLEIDYLKPELLLRKHGIEGTIVVFGSTRICEPAEAERNLAALASGDAAERKSAERIRAKAHYYEVARAFGRLVGIAGRDRPDRRIVIMTGAGPGIMEAANRGAFDADAQSVGLNITLPHEQFPNPYVSPELCFRLHYFAIRKLHFLLRAKALVAFPGGYGTFDELFETLTLVQTRTIKPIPVVLVGEAFWRRAADIDFLLQEGVIDKEDRDLFWYAETAEQIWESILLWHEAAGTPLFGPPDFGVDDGPVDGTP